MTQAPLKSQTSEAVVTSGCCISQATAEQIPKLCTKSHSGSQKNVVVWSQKSGMRQRKIREEEREGERERERKGSKKSEGLLGAAVFY